MEGQGERARWVHTPLCCDGVSTWNIREVSLLLHSVLLFLLVPFLPPESEFRFHWFKQKCGLSSIESWVFYFLSLQLCFTFKLLMTHWMSGVRWGWAGLQGLHFLAGWPGSGAGTSWMPNKCCSLSDPSFTIHTAVMGSRQKRRIQCQQMQEDAQTPSSHIMGPTSDTCDW